MSLRNALLYTSIVLSAAAVPAVAQVYVAPPQVVIHAPPPPHVVIHGPPPPHVVVHAEPVHAGPAPKRIKKGNKGKGWAKGHDK